MIRLLASIVAALAFSAFAQDDSTVNGPDTGAYRTVMEKHPYQVCYINKNDTVYIQATIRRKNNTGAGTYTNMGHLRYIKPTKSDTGSTTVLWNIGASFLDVECDSCSKR